jgi:FkbM family methyltransferase
MAARRFPRHILNTLYSLLSLEQKVRVHWHFAKIFRGYDGVFAEGRWRLTFCGKPLWIPLRQQFAWLDWDVSLSVLGHDPEIKQTYATLIQLERPPRLVVDVGTNYGTHSIIFLINDIATISFEPNRACHSLFRLICEMNGVQAQIEPVGLGAGEEVIDLWYPEKEEWNGTTRVSVMETLGGQLTKTAVMQTTVDSYLGARRVSPDVLKVDTEGADLQVLQGAAETLKRCRPLVLFESWEASDRSTLFSFLAQRDYLVARLPLLASTAPEVLTYEQFLRDSGMNFAGLPSEVISSWPPHFGDQRGH